MTGQFRNKYKIAGPQTWELVRAAYLSGESAQVVAERYGVTVPAIRRRAWKERWTKRDLAAALEARGIAPPPPPGAPDYIEPHIGRAKERVAAEAERSAELDQLVERIAAEEDASDIAAAIERRALAQASAAMVQGRSKEAQALASMAEMMRKRVTAVPPMIPLVVQREALSPSPHLPPEELERRALAKVAAALERGDAAEARALTAVAEQMRKRVEEAQATEKAAGDAVELDQAENEETANKFFAMAAMLASHMVHQPGSAPAAFLRLIARWRELNLGEGEADAEKRAAIVAEAQRRHLEGSAEENFPEDVRAYVQARWEETRLRLKNNEAVGVVKKVGERWGEAEVTPPSSAAGSDPPA